MISGVYFMIWWLHSIRSAWGQEVRSQLSCWFRGEIKITPAVTTSLQFLHRNWRILVQEYKKAKPIKQRVFWALACSAAQSNMVNQYSSMTMISTHLSQSWSSHGTDFLLHLSDCFPKDILHHSWPSISPTEASFSNGSPIGEKLKWGHSWLTYCETEGVCSNGKKGNSFHPPLLPLLHTVVVTAGLEVEPLLGWPDMPGWPAHSNWLLLSPPPLAGSAAAAMLPSTFSIQILTSILVSRWPQYWPPTHPRPLLWSKEVTCQIWLRLIQW